MKCLVGLAILAAVVAAPTHAQTAHSVGAGAQAGATNAGGAGFLGGGFGGGSFGSRLASVPPTRFDMVIASGSQQSYVPSTFLPYDKAITAGRMFSMSLLRPWPKLHNGKPARIRKKPGIC